jgi:hypothetical protein
VERPAKKRPRARAEKEPFFRPRDGCCSDERVSLVNHDAVDGTATRRWRLGYRLVVAAAVRTRPGAMRA